MGELRDFVLIGREALKAKIAEIKAIDKIGAADDARRQVLSDAQDLSEALIDAEVRLGELIADLPEAQGKRTDLELPGSAAPKLTKREAITEIGVSLDQAKRYEQLAAHPDIVNYMKTEAREAGEIISRTAISRVISAAKKPYITNNSGDSEWYTPSQYIESARAVMGHIDLDPSSCEYANRTIQADEYFTAEDDGLIQEWTGRIWLNPPYNLAWKFVAKLLESDFEEAIVLTNNATETQWFKGLA